MRPGPGRSGHAAPIPTARPRPNGASRPAQPAPKAASGSVRSRTTSARSRQPRSIRRIFARIGVLVFALVLVAIGAVLVMQQQVAAQVALDDVRPNRPIAKPLVTPINILLLGVDSRPDHPEEGIRSDSLLLLHLDPAGGWANLLAVPRDSIADIPNVGQTKINTAFAQGYGRAAEFYGEGTDATAGGAALAGETVENFLGLRGLGTRVDYVATINFDGFAAMIDAVGGIDVDVPFTIIDEEYPTPDYGTMRIEIPEGRQHMDGARALQYVRTRHADSDFGRAQRQQQVVSAMVAAIRDKPAPLQPFAAWRLARAAGGAIKTTLPVGRPDALLMGLMMTRLDPAAIGTFRITPETVQGYEIGSDLVWDATSLQAYTQQWLARPGVEQEQATVQVRNGAEIGGLAGRVTETLAAAGFTTTAPATDEPVAQSVIIDYTAKPRTRERLQEVLGNMPVEEHSAGEAPPGVDIAVILGADYGSYVGQ
jgi:polyisoprenyl-teichoic acid--peptidoglycan teichoic acid transferase